MASHFIPSALPTYDIIGLAYEPDIEQCSLYEKSVKGTFSMPTPEERVTTLEYNLDQFNAEATTYYQEMAMQVTMSKGLTEDAVKRLMQLRVQVDKRFNSTDQQLAEVKQELAAVQTTLAQILARLPEKP
jgi:hypothetical protein